MFVQQSNMFFLMFTVFFFQICVVCFHICVYLFSHVFVFCVSFSFHFGFVFFLSYQMHICISPKLVSLTECGIISRGIMFRQDSNHQRIKQFFAMKLLLVVQWINEFFPDPCQLFLWNLAEKPIEHDWTNPHMTINSWQLPKQMKSNKKQWKITKNSEK